MKSKKPLAFDFGLCHRTEIHLRFSLTYLCHVRCNIYHHKVLATWYPISMSKELKEIAGECISMSKTTTVNVCHIVAVTLLLSRSMLIHIEFLIVK